MIILAYGVKQPTTGDKGSVFFPALEELCQRMATHKHDNIDSHPVASPNVTQASVDIPSANWLPVVGKVGVYYQDFGLPAGYTTLTSIYEVRDFTTDEKVYPSITKIDDVSMRIFTGLVASAYKVYFK